VITGGGSRWPLLSRMIHSSMQTKTESARLCPNEGITCPWWNELSELRQRVDQLQELVSHDPLTGLFNFRHFSDTLPAVLEKTRRSLRPSCLIIVDLDHFKNINDTWGHEIGNIALKRAAGILTQQVRMVDVVCRYGGEEFVVILPDTRLRQAVEVAERIRRAIEQTTLVFDGGELNFTASMGVDVYRSEAPVSSEEFIDSVDKLLYQAKHAGRNRVCHRDFAEVESVTQVSQDERDALFELFGN